MNKSRAISILIGLVLLLANIGWIYEVYHFLNNFREIDAFELTLTRSLKAIYYSNRYFNILVSVLATVGFFSTNKKGWMAVTTFFYYLLFTILIIALPSSPPKTALDYLLIPIPLVFVWLINASSFRAKYRVSDRSILTINLNTMTISVLVVCVKGYLFLNHQLGIWELIDKVK